jgi:hypothetical protein
VTLLFEDSEDSTQAFVFNGPIPADYLRKWIDETGYLIPEELFDTWATLGGGDLFESETLFQPIPDHLDDIEAENRRLWKRGLSASFLVFHSGVVISAIDQMSGEIVTFDLRTMTELRRFLSLNEWYRETVRKEFAARYGLAPI